MNSKILVIGSGAEFAQRALQELGHDDVVIVSPEDASQLPFQKSEPYIINHPPHLPSVSGLFEEKQFVCKGIHQYREVRETKDNVTYSSWVCQCGRKL